MIRLIEALNFRCLRYIRQPLGPFHVLVGPNASGKTSLLDVPAFIYSLFQNGLEKAVRERSDNILDLIWRNSQDQLTPALNHFELAIEFSLPDDIGNGGGNALRYCVAVGLDHTRLALTVRREELRILRPGDSPPEMGGEIPGTIFYGQGELISPGGTGQRTKAANGADSTLPITASDQPVATSSLNPFNMEGLLANGVSRDSFFRQPLAMYHGNAVKCVEFLYKAFCTLVTLHDADLRKPSPPGHGITTRWTGENLPNIVDHLSKFAPERFDLWQRHLRTALPDLESVRIYTRQEDRKQFLSVAMKNGCEFPQWSLSEGTLDLLALTVLAYLPSQASTQTFMVEEPESHIHPLNIEVVFQSLSSVYEGQVLISTHSPTVLALADPATVLVFSRDLEGGTQIVRGDRHPRLRDWQGEMDLATLYATGVLG